MGNDSSTQAQAPPAEAPPISKPLEDDLDSVKKTLDAERAEDARQAKLKAKQDAKRGATSQDKAEKAAFEKDQKRKEATKVAKAEREALGVKPAAEAAEDPTEKLSKAEKLAYLRNKAMGLAEDTKDTGIDTLLTVDAQLKQTREDNKKLININATLDEAEASISELEKGFWNISSSGRAIDLPAREDGDVEVPIQMWKNVFVRYHHYTIRNCKTFLMRINHNGELKDTVTYTSIKGVNCMKDGFSEIVFMPTVPFDKWTMYTEGDALETLVKDLAQRKVDQGGDLKVTFETGVPIFEYKPIKSSEDRHRAFESNPKYGGARAGKSSKKMSKFQQEQAASDAFYDNMLGNLDSINDIQTEVGHQLSAHNDELKKQERLVKDTNTRIKPTLKRMDKWVEEHG